MERVQSEPNSARQVKDDEFIFKFNNQENQSIESRKSLKSNMNTLTDILKGNIIDKIEKRIQDQKIIILKKKSKQNEDSRKSKELETSIQNQINQNVVNNTQIQKITQNMNENFKQKVKELSQNTQCTLVKNVFNLSKNLEILGNNIQQKLSTSSSHHNLNLNNTNQSQNQITNQPGSSNSTARFTQNLIKKLNNNFVVQTERSPQNLQKENKFIAQGYRVQSSFKNQNQSKTNTNTPRNEIIQKNNVQEAFLNKSNQITDGDLNKSQLQYQKTQFSPNNKNNNQISILQYQGGGNSSPTLLQTSRIVGLKLQQTQNQVQQMENSSSQVQENKINQIIQNQNIPKQKMSIYFSKGTGQITLGNKLKNQLSQEDEKTMKIFMNSQSKIIKQYEDNYNNNLPQTSQTARNNYNQANKTSFQFIKINQTLLKQKSQMIPNNIKKQIKLISERFNLDKITIDFKNLKNKNFNQQTTQNTSQLNQTQNSQNNLFSSTQNNFHLAKNNYNNQHFKSFQNNNSTNYQNYNKVQNNTQNTNNSINCNKPSTQQNQQENNNQKNKTTFGPKDIIQLIKFKKRIFNLQDYSKIQSNNKDDIRYDSLQNYYNKKYEQPTEKEFKIKIKSKSNNNDKKSEHLAPWEQEIKDKAFFDTDNIIENHF